MFPINAAVIKAVALLLVVIIVASGLWYVTGLRADLAVSTENAKKLSDGIAEQQADRAQQGHACTPTHQGHTFTAAVAQPPPQVRRKHTGDRLHGCEQANHPQAQT